MAKLPLEGIRIIDMGIIWAGPFSTIMLADMGAEVILVESLQHFNQTRGNAPYPPEAAMRSETVGSSYVNHGFGPERPYNCYATFNYGERNKLSATLDLTRPKGREILLRLVKISDVFMENNAYGTMPKLGVTYEVLRAARPDIIMLAFPGYGNTGPYRHFKGLGANVEALVGHTWLRGYPDSDPSTTYSVYHADPAAGATAAFAVLAAIHHRRKTGQGQYIDMSQAENVIHHLSQAVMDYSMNGRGQGTLGNRDPSMVQGCYRCAGEDKWLVLSLEDDEEFVALGHLMGKPGLAQDPRFADAVSRYHNHDALDTIISAWTADKDHYELFHLLQRAGIPAGPVVDFGEVLHEPHLRARNFFLRTTHPDAGTHDYAGHLFRLSEGQPPNKPAPTLGQHNDYVYRELLGMAEEEYQQLRAEDYTGEVPLQEARLAAS